MQQYCELVDWQGLKLPSAERRQRDSLKSFERSVEVWKDRIRLKKEFATLGDELPPVEWLPAKCKEQSPDPIKKNAKREEFGRRALAGSNMWESLSCLLTLLESLNKQSSDGDRQCGEADTSKDSAAQLGQHSQAAGHWGGGPTPRDTSIQPMEAALNQTMFLTQAQALLGKAIGEKQSNKT